MIDSPANGRLRYVALGDSYTIGTSVEASERWPDRLVAALDAAALDAAALDAAAPSLELVGNIAVNGYTSRDVIDLELPQLAELRPDFVTLLIGVNDVVRGVTHEAYRENVEAILDDLVARVGADRILAITTPDYTVTPAGGRYGDPARQAAGIRTNNQILASLAAARGIAVVDVHDISLGAASDRSFVASDDLHPSGRQYALWVERVLPAVEQLLAR